MSLGLRKVRAGSCEQVHPEGVERESGTDSLANDLREPGCLSAAQSGAVSPETAPIDLAKLAAALQSLSPADREQLATLLTARQADSPTHDNMANAH